ncbi:L-lactate permease [Actinomadura bangladeshensis]|uniref:L-lactate permease n=1 Tax=Actinomadura bangladeshensis TaxID=453573 RepID=A0A4R4NT48_9ACTN|nr:L-lactate permease [Actinomadura bangladeshensis]TDC12154.1 L-lactate permease [Actinomadura bangladeshensis]
MYQQVLDPVADSLGWSSLVAALPLAVLFVLLGGVRMRAWLASLIALAVSLAVAIWTYGMPADQAFLAGTEGAAFGFYPILWIVINALWVYNITVTTGHFDVLRRSFASVSDDNRLQAVLIAFSFGALLEALAGFGTPVAVTSVMLIALGFQPLKAAVLALTANTAPVAFGAMATPILTLGKVTGESSDTLGAMVGRQTPILALFVPLVLVAIVDGKRGLRETWPTALICGAAFGAAQYVTANFISVPLADVVASLVSAAAVVLVVRLRPRPSVRPAPVAGGAADEPTPEFAARVESGGERDPRAEVARAYAPYAIIIAVFVICQIDAVKSRLDKATRTFSWPGLDLTGPTGKPLSLPTFNFNYLTTPGTQMLVAGLITMAALGVGLGKALRAYWTTLVQLKWAIITVMAVLALAFVMNASGQTVTLGTWMAGAGGAFAVLSPILGWLGTAVTGSDTSSNSLFGALQVTAANKADLDTVLMAATNSSGGVLGKMVSPQNLAIAAAAVGLDGREGDIFRRVVLWSLLFLAGMCLLSGLQSTGVLGWMVP